jgi:CheY-like chemotaxis protein
MNLLVICKLSTGDQFSAASGRSSRIARSRLFNTVGPGAIPVNSRIVDYSVIVMARIRILHWKPAESAPLIEACRACGFEVEYDDIPSPALIKMIRRNQPDAVVIDLTRLPSHGREAALAIRRTKYSRHIPIVFVDGEPEKVEALRQWLPDATFCARKQLCSKIKSACANPIQNPVAPPGVMERYGSRTKAQKLGIKEGSTVAVIDPPGDYETVLGDLPEGVQLLENPATVHPVTLWFVRDPDAFLVALRRMRAIAAKTKLWVVRPKGPKSLLNENFLRKAANEVDLVDYKICAVDDYWTGIVFARRRS